MEDIFNRSIIIHEQLRGKLGVHLKMPIKNQFDLSIAYTPGVAGVCESIKKNPELAHKYTIKNNTVAIVSDGSAVLGLGNIGPLASLPVMEGKAMLFRQFAHIDAWPLCLDTQDTEEIIKTVKNISPVFSGINLEDISAPKCFEIENRLQDIGIPVFHDDQHGTAIVLLAALINACKLLNKKFEDLVVVINGAGAAGTAIAKLLNYQSQFSHHCVKDIIVCDSKGAISKERKDLNQYKKELLKFSNKENRDGTLTEILEDAGVFIGVSKGNILTQKEIKKMNDDPIIFAMANPIPEIMPDVAISAGAAVVGTGRSDFPNQVNNVLAFPGIFRGALDSGVKSISPEMKLAAALGLANSVEKITKNYILPSALDFHVANLVAKEVKETAMKNIV